MESILKGQRWISDMEPELGLGIVTEVDPRKVRVHFRAADCERQYAIQSAPLRRVRFQPGDTVKTNVGEAFGVERIEDRNGILVYIGGGREIPEQQLSDALSFTTPKERLLGGLLDSNRAFDLRIRTLEYQSALRKSPVRGFLGGRIELIPHQIYVANEVVSRSIPRVLLSDDVGLGKTIEAGLILHRLLLAGRISRVLVLVPESLVHQWFVELLRKFNLIFRLMNEEHCASIESAEPEANPFLKDQLCIASMPFLLNGEKRQKQAVEAGWDMMAVDEAHHLIEGSADYRLVETLGIRTPGLMLLTATPEQLGHRSHFARLRLLDPDRYRDFETFKREERHYRKTARLAEKLLTKQKLHPEEKRLLNRMFHDLHMTDDAASRKILTSELLDRRGMGRVMFRNTRAVMTGFPERDVRLIPLEADGDAMKRLAEEFRADAENRPQDVDADMTRDPRISWLAGMMKELKGRKVLLICRTTEKVLAIDRALQSRLKIHTSLFHDGLTLIQRDRNAAWFAKIDGADICICSEIGSEGRNFQFAHYLILFDLPLDPEQVEQRIGRLDRIGQKETIHLHIPFVPGSPQEILVRWIHEGLGAFRQNIPGAYELYRRLGHRLKTLALENGDVDIFLKETRREYGKIARRVEKGRDRLLELQSFDEETAESLIRAIQTRDKDGRLMQFTETLLEQYGIRIEESADRMVQIRFDSLVEPAFPVPVFRDQDLTATFDRSTAVHREDIEFLTWDHPMITGAMELLLGSEKGNCAAVFWPKAESNEILLEAAFVLECVAPPRLYADRFLPPVPVRVMVNHLLEDRCGLIPAATRPESFQGVPPASLLQNPGIKSLIPRMIARCQEIAQKSANEITGSGLEQMENALQREIQRLEELKKVNPNVREEEMTSLKNEQAMLRETILSARLRLDALRLIFPNPEEKSFQ